MSDTVPMDINGDGPVKANTSRKATNGEKHEGQNGQVDEATGYTWSRDEDAPGYSWNNRRAQDEELRTIDHFVGSRKGLEDAEAWSRQYDHLTYICPPKTPVIETATTALKLDWTRDRRMEWEKICERQQLTLKQAEEALQNDTRGDNFLSEEQLSALMNDPGLRMKIAARETELKNAIAKRKAEMK